MGLDFATVLDNVTTLTRVLGSARAKEWPERDVSGHDCRVERVSTPERSVL